MSTRISRRTVATGAAWSVPVLAVSAAAPAMAASGCTAVASVAGTHTNGQSTVAISVSFNVSGEVCVTGLSATGGQNGNVTLTYVTTPPASGTCGSTGTVTFAAGASANGNTVKGSYTGTVSYTVGGQACVETKTFTVTAPV